MTTGTSWRIQGDILEVCSCNVTCPCNFGGEPTKSPCDAVWGLRIQQGNYGNTRLNGLNVVLYFRIPGKVFDGNWTLGAYLDQRANQQQMEALGNNLGGKAGGMFAALGGLIGKALPPKQAPIRFETIAGEHRVTVPGFIEAGSERIPNPMPGQPPMDTKVTGLMVPIFGGTSNIRRSTTVKVTDPNLRFEYAGRSSVTAQFDLKGP
jgi:hypothetical protein